MNTDCRDIRFDELVLVVRRIALDPFPRIFSNERNHVSYQQEENPGTCPLRSLNVATTCVLVVEGVVARPDLSLGRPPVLGLVARRVTGGAGRVILHYHVIVTRVL